MLRPYLGIEAKIFHADALEETNCNFCGGSLVDEDTEFPKLCTIKEDCLEFHKIISNIFIEHVEQAVIVLKIYHPLDLYLLLKEVRSMRSDSIMEYEC